MNKKKIIFFFIILAIIMTALMFKINNQNKGELLPTTITENAEGVRLYYYNSIPGLARAEQSDMVTPIHKTYEIPDTDSILKIDRIWYNDKRAYVFYHVENIHEIAYLGGSFSLYDDNDFCELNPRDFVGKPTEKGVFFNNSFYSFLEIPPIDDIDKDLGEEKEKISFKPTLFIQDLKYSFKPIDIEWGLINMDEPVEMFELDAQLELLDNTIKLHKLEAGVSYNKIYFSYIGSHAGIIYDFKAHVYTDEGESFAIFDTPILINNDEGKYYVEMPPFDELPTSFNIQLESISIIGEDSIHGIIDTQTIKKKKGIQALDIDLDSVMDTDIILENIHFIDNDVKIGLLYDNQKDNNLFLEARSIFYNDQERLLTNINNDGIIIPNIFSLQNNFGQVPESEDYSYPHISHKTDNRICFTIPLDFWEKSDEIFISIDNLTYGININQSIEVALMSE